MTSTTCEPSTAPDVWSTGRALFVSQAVAGGLGAIAWALAARTHAASEVGAAIGVVGGLTFAGLLGTLGLGSTLIGALPNVSRRTRPVLAGTGLQVAAIAGGAAGAAIVAVLLAAGDRVGGLASDPLVALAVIGGAAAWAAGVAADAVAVVVRRPGLAVLRAAISGGGRLLLLLAAIAADRTTAAALVIAWGATMALSTGVIALLLWGRGAIGHRAGALRDRGPDLALSSVRSHFPINLLGQTPPMVLPLLLVLVSRPVEAAAFGAAWQIAAAVGMVSPAVATGLFASGSAQPDAIGALSRRTRRATVSMVAGAAAALALVGPTVLGLLGPAYQERGTVALWLLAGALVLDALVNLDIAELRVAHRYGRALQVNGLIATTAVTATAAFGPRLGATGAAVAWLAAQAAGVALMGTERVPPPIRRDQADADLARARLEPAGAGERGGAIDAPAGGAPAAGRARGPRAAREPGGPQDHDNVRYGPWAATSGARAEPDCAS